MDERICWPMTLRLFRINEDYSRRNYERQTKKNIMLCKIIYDEIVKAYRPEINKHLCVCFILSDLM